MSKHFNYHLSGAGWAEVSIVSDKQKVQFDVSYLSDPLHELCIGLTALLTGNLKEVEVDFLDEPGEHRLLLKKSNDQNLETEVLWSEEWGEWKAKENVQVKGESIYREVDTIYNFSTIVCIGIQDLLNRHSLDDYRQKWVEHDFPSEAFKKLKAACRFEQQ